MRQKTLSINITSFLKKGENTIAVLVWHFGTDSQRYIKAQAGLIFELQSSDNVLLASGENTHARYSVAYKQGVQKLVTRQLGFSFAYGDLLEESKKCTHAAFYNADEGLCSMTVGGDEYTVLGNALAILAGLELDKEYVCEKIVNGELSDCSLSMKIFKYDALLATDKEKYQEWVLNEIRREYGKMIERGDTVWETIDGASAFDNAGSLCHGWSAVPILFLNNF